MPSTGRALGPFADVSTERVEGAYEICLGTDDRGRRVEILTLGTTSSKDPGRRRLLADAVAWARGSHTPADAPILDARLDAEQPYVVALHDERLRGIGRLLDWLLRMGPSTGPLQRITAPVPAHLMHPQPAPVSSPVPPPASPIVVGRRPKRRAGGPMVAFIVGALALIVFGGGTLAVWIAQDDTGSDTAAQGQGEPAPNATGDGEEPPHLDLDRDPLALPSTTEVWELTNADDAEVMAVPEWPFAWRYDSRLDCVPQSRQRVVCDLTEPFEGAEAAHLSVELAACPDACPRAVRENLLPDGEAWNPVDEDGRAFVAVRVTGEAHHLRFVRYLEPEEPGGLVRQIVVSGVSVGPAAETMVERSINDVYTQSA